jgi:cytochrome c oxidase subunit 2
MFFFNFINITFCDTGRSWQLGFQDPATPTVEGMLHFHNYLMIFLIAILVFVFWMLFQVIMYFNSESNKTAKIFTHSSFLEIVWTIIPAFILILVAIPSFALLYSLEELIDPVLTIKIIGHQWYWSYEIADVKIADFINLGFNIKANINKSLFFDSYMVATDDLIDGRFRLLEVDNRFILPIKTHLRLLITSADVLHSWAVPSFGIKVDATPGRLSQAALFIKREGFYYGQCSEICGVNHGFMPIVVEGLPTFNFMVDVASKLDDLAEQQFSPSSPAKEGGRLGPWPEDYDPIYSFVVIIFLCVTAIYLIDGGASYR